MKERLAKELFEDSAEKEIPSQKGDHATVAPFFSYCKQALCSELFLSQSPKLQKNQSQDQNFNCSAN